MTHAQGWTRADHRCGQCGHTYSATTEAEFLAAWQLHAAAHDVAACLLASPDIHGQVLALMAPTTAGLSHDCRDCTERGGIGFDCHHLVRGVRVADACAWCRAHGYRAGQVIPGQEASRIE